VIVNLGFYTVLVATVWQRLSPQADTDNVTSRTSLTYDDSMNY